MANSVPDSPVLTVPSVRSESDWQSLHEEQQLAPQPPLIILDANCPFIVKSSTQELQSRIQRLKNLPLPIFGLDSTPDLPSKKPGALESSLGAARVCDIGGLCVGTKVKMTGSALGLGRGELKAGQVRASLRGSLHKLRKRKVNWLIAQRQDAEVSIGELTGGFQGLVGEGWAETWGVKEYQVRPFRDILKTCERRGYHKPRIYQGEYSILSRKNEKIMPLLRTHGISFHAYDPTAKGLLFDQSQTDRGQPGDLQSGSSARTARFDNSKTQEAVKRIAEAGEKQGISLQGTALRWLAFHSELLGQQDCIILEGLSYEDLEEKVSNIAKGRLPEEVLKEILRLERTTQDTKLHGPAPVTR